MKFGQESYGQVQYGSMESEYSIPEVVKSLIDYLPRYYKQSNIMTTLQNALSQEVNALTDAIFDVLNQLFVDTATWGLELWETDLDIPIDKTKPSNYRRSTIKAKMRGTDITTIGALKKVSEIFSRGETTIFEYPTESKFVVKFIGTRGIPPGMLDLTNTIELIKPAHLTFSYEYTYCEWFEAKTYKWNLTKLMTWDGFHIARPWGQ